MKYFLALAFGLALWQSSYTQTKTIHVFVALCDNEHQGIVPVPKSIGNGKEPKTNLYWGAGYGVKNFFQNKTRDWELVGTYDTGNPHVLQRLLFRHVDQDAYLLADAYDGEQIKACIEDFLKTANRQMPVVVRTQNQSLYFGGQSNLLAYVGHDGLMDFNIDVKYKPKVENPVDVIILACYSKKYFSTEIQKASANPILWTTHLIAPEAYTLKSAIDGWLINETGAEIKERAAQTYHQYQKCGIKGARNLFTSGF